MMKNGKIDILALQEMHLTDETREELNALFSRKIHIVSSLDLNQPNAKGIAFIINKRTMR